MIAPVVLMTLLASAAIAAEDTDITGEKKETVVAERILADTATTAAVEDAIKTVLVELKMDLDNRFSGQTSLTTVDGP